LLIVLELPESEPVKHRRVERSQENQDLPEAEEPTTFQHLQAVTRRVSRQTIEANWEPLPSSCIERISQILQDLQRPVVVRYNDERKRAQSSTALQMISRRLVSKISKGLPFPQGTRNHREDDFDFEKILDHNRALEAQLTPALHANELLEAQLSKEMALLESEQKGLADLEANAKIETALRGQAARKLHSLLQPDGGTFAIEALKDDIGLGIGHIPRLFDLDVSLLLPWCLFIKLSPYQIQDDEHLQALVKEVHGHVDSIQGNLRQVEGVPQAISMSKAAVQATLFGHLDSAQYEEVVLGAE
jgi:CENP-Q, a CENPA-CAD centromere complex subunit